MKRRKITTKAGLFFLSVLCLNLSFGQVEYSESHRHDIFEDIGHSDNLVYTFNGIPKVYDKQSLTTFNLQGKKLASIELQSKQGLELIETISLGSNTLFYFDYNYQKRILLLLVDANGKEVKRLDKEYLKTTNPVAVAMGNDRFVLAASVKVKKQGLQVECYDNNLEMQWDYTNIPEKSKYWLKHVDANSKGEIGILYGEKLTSHHVLMLDASGNVTGTSEVNVGDMTKYTPYKAKFINDDDFVVIADHGETTNQVFAQTSTGVSVKMFNKQAEEIANQSLGFAAVQEKMGDRLPDGTLAFKEIPAIRVLDIQLVNNAYSLICESYYIKQEVKSEVTSTSPGSVPTNVTYGTINLVDLYTLQLDDLTQMHRMWKPKRAISIRGINSYYSYKDYCELLEKNQMFSYQFVKDNSLFIRGFGQNYEYFNTIPLDQHYDNLLTRTYWGRPISDKPVRQNFVQLFYKDGFTYRGGVNYDKFIQTPNGVLLYHYHTPTNNLQFSILN